jgi:hypothetical protein
MGSPLSSTMAEIYLQYFEELIIKHGIETSEIIYYRRYVDDTIIFDQNKTNEGIITNHINNIHKHLEFKPTAEENNINYLDVSIHRNNHSLQMGIYRKPTQRDTTIYFTSNHPLEHKLAAYNFYINRTLSVPITDQARQHEWNTICTIARNNGFPIRTIHNLTNRITKTQNIDNTFTNTQRKTWVTFTYHSPLIRKITNLFKHTNLNIAFRTGNTIYNWLQDRMPQNTTSSSVKRATNRT